MLQNPDFPRYSRMKNIKFNNKKQEVKILKIE